MQGFRNYNLEAMQREQLHVVDLMPPLYGKSTPPMSPNSGKCPSANWKVIWTRNRQHSETTNDNLSPKKHVSVLCNNRDDPNA